MADKKRSQRRIRTAVVLLAVVAACLGALLILLPSGSPRRDSLTGGRTPEQSARDTPPATSLRQPEAPSAAPHREPEDPAGGTGPVAVPERPKAKARIAVVIDDVGHNLETLGQFLDFPGPLTFAVLPQLAYTRESVRLIRAAGKEMILHLPMEAVNGEDPGPGAVLSSHSEAEIRRIVAEDLDGLEAAVGANNHMGSRATADPRVMAVIMECLAESGRFFLDSRTTPDSVAADAARAAAVRFLERDVFIDNQTDPSSIRSALDRGAAVARAEGAAVLIGHIYNPQMLEILEEVLAEAGPAGVRLVPLSELVGQGRGTP
ncbi:MAG: divergent polysaccharide deacetylase family protein [Spirochaetales bacterium]|nr:divergent polysaccharide deacetylase family protein [Spirochaetales bacterium]